MKSSNDEQKAIAKKIYALLSQLSSSDKLMKASGIIAPVDLIRKIGKNPKVCFVYYKYSEFAEDMVKHIEDTSCKAVIVDESGQCRICVTKEQIVHLSERTVDNALIGDEFFKVTFEPKEGEILITKDNELLIIGKLIGSGGEGAVFDCSQPGYVIKIYQKGQLTKLRLKKLTLMEKKQVRYDGVCWPEKIVYSGDGEPVGYLMKKINGKPLTSVFDSSEHVLEEFPKWNKQNLISLSIDLLEKIHYLHLFGIIIGDLRMNNIVIDKNGVPILVDIDSCQIDDLPCPTGYPDYTPPELQKIEFKKNLRTYANENFSCAVLIFKILFCGIHPYDQKNGAESIEEDISSKSFPYPPNSMGDFSLIPWGGYEQMWRYTPYQLQAFFYDIFKNGKRYDLQEMIVMLKTYNEFINLNKTSIPDINVIAFNYD